MTPVPSTLRGATAGDLLVLEWWSPRRGEWLPLRSVTYRHDQKADMQARMEAWQDNCPDYLFRVVRRTVRVVDEVLA